MEFMISFGKTPESWLFKPTQALLRIREAGKLVCLYPISGPYQLVLELE